MYNLPAKEITREILFNVGGSSGFARWFIYIPLIVVLVLIYKQLGTKIKLWRTGQKENRTDNIPERIKGLFTYGLAQTKILRQNYAGLMHVSLVWGFVVLAIGTTIILVQEDFTALFWGENGKFIYGSFYLWFSLLLDLFGVVAIIGALMAFFRRYLQRPKQLDNKNTDLYALALILVILITGFISEGLRIAITGFPIFEVWSPIGWLVAKGAANLGLSVESMKIIHKINWWFHYALALLFLYSLTSGRLLHLVTSTTNIFFRNLEPKGLLTIIPPESFETAENFGVAKVSEFTWKQLLDGDACTRCGRCEDACPAASTEKTLSPKKLIQDVNDNLYAKSAKELIGDLVKEDELWSCTNCSACQEECPVLIEHIQKITDMRRNLVLMQGKMDESLQNTLRNMETNGNPYGIGFSTRGDWAKETSIKTLAENADVDYLYYVGCAGSFDDKNKGVARALVSLLLKAGLKVGILGEEETCCGDSALRVGNEYLFQMLAKQNIETFKKYNVKKIITTCPHGLNIFKKEYKELGADLDVYHHTEILSDLLKRGKIKIDRNKAAASKELTYHDSCFLGRYNELYSAPREILKALPNVKFTEMANHHSKSFCCGGGGGRMWMEETQGTRINHKRLEDAKAGTIATACPFCLTMLSDATNETNQEEKYQVKDIAEILVESVE